MNLLKSHRLGATVCVLSIIGCIVSISRDSTTWNCIVYSILISLWGLLLGAYIDSYRKLKREEPGSSNEGP